MIDAIAIVTTHLLMLVAFWRLCERDDLDDEGAPDARHAPPGFLPPRQGG
jgi:hypothetical protein